MRSNSQTAQGTRRALENKRFRMSALGQRLTAYHMSGLDRLFEIMRLKREEYEDRQWTVESAEQMSLNITKEEAKRHLRTQKMPHIKKLPSRKLQQRSINGKPGSQGLRKLNEPNLPLNYNFYSPVIKTQSYTPEIQEGASANAVGDRIGMYGGGGRRGPPVI